MYRYSKMEEKKILINFRNFTSHSLDPRIKVHHLFLHIHPFKFLLAFYLSLVLFINSLIHDLFIFTSFPFYFQLHKFKILLFSYNIVFLEIIRFILTFVFVIMFSTKNSWIEKTFTLKSTSVTEIVQCKQIHLWINYLISY